MGRWLIARETRQCDADDDGVGQFDVVIFGGEGLGGFGGLLN